MHALRLASLRVGGYRRYLIGMKTGNAVRTLKSITLLAAFFASTSLFSAPMVIDATGTPIGAFMGRTFSAMLVLSPKNFMFEVSVYRENPIMSSVNTADALSVGGILFESTDCSGPMYAVVGNPQAWPNFIPEVWTSMGYVGSYFDSVNPGQYWMARKGQSATLRVLRSALIEPGNCSPTNNSQPSHSIRIEPNDELVSGVRGNIAAPFSIEFRAASELLWDGFENTKKSDKSRH